MNTADVAKKLVELCKEGKNDEAIASLYAKDIVSVEAMAPPGKNAETRGIDGVKGKSEWWAANHTVHSATVEGPYVNGDKFCVRFKYDITNKQMGKRMLMDEIAVYTVSSGKVTREEFYY